MKKVLIMFLISMPLCIRAQTPNAKITSAFDMLKTHFAKQKTPLGEFVTSFDTISITDLGLKEDVVVKKVYGPENPFPLHKKVLGVAIMSDTLLRKLRAGLSGFGEIILDDSLVHHSSSAMIASEMLGILYLSHQLSKNGDTQSIGFFHAGYSLQLEFLNDTYQLNAGRTVPHGDLNGYNQVAARATNSFAQLVQLQQVPK